MLSGLFGKNRLGFNFENAEERADPDQRFEFRQIDDSAGEFSGKSACHWAKKLFQSHRIPIRFHAKQFITRPKRFPEFK